jgi:3-oxoacyl-[acyl-carrier-protein] synthase II
LTMSTATKRRVVITGVGAVCPLGKDARKLPDLLRAKASGIRPFTQLPHHVLPVSAGGEAIEFTGDIEDYGPMDKTLQRTIRKGTKVMCREIEMGVAVAQLAMTDAGLTPENRDRDRTGVIYGCDYIISLPQEYAAGIKNCIGDDGRFDFERWGADGKPQINPLWLLKYLPNMPASHIAIYNDLRGPNNSLTIREASPAAAISEAFSTIQRGHADVLVVGSTGSRIHPLRTLHAALQEELAKDRQDYESMCRPFDTNRDGAVVGEGAGAMVLETYEHATARGANILGEVMGAGSSAVGPQGNAAGHENYIELAVRNVIRAAIGDTDPSSIGHIHAHGAGTHIGDAQEAQAIARIFGAPEKQPPVTTAKGHFGNLGAGGGMVEVIASLMSLGNELFPIRNLHDLADDCPINACKNSGVPSGDSFVSVNYTPQGQATAVRIQACR